MSIIEVYNPKFDDFHDEPVVTWREGRGPIRVQVNLLDQYLRWRRSKLPKHEPSPVFWESRGPEIARALAFCGARALVTEYTSERRVAYKWFGLKPDTHAGSTTLYVCSVSAEGGFNGSDSRVRVVLPTDEEVTFLFRWSQMESWRKPRALTVEEAASKPGGPDPRFGEG